MKQKNVAAGSSRQKLLKLPATAEFDAMCAAYLDADAARDRLWQQLYALARSQGSALKNAPRSRLLAGVQFEALASLATRTDLDQVAAGRAQTKLSYAQHLAMTRVFTAETIWKLEPDWERLLAHLPATPREKCRARVLACLRTRPVKRLTVRKRKSSPQRAQRPQRRAA